MIQNNINPLPHQKIKIYQLFEQYGETEETLPELEELNNAAERARTFYNRLYGLVLQVAESQPIANSTLLN